eukprot:10527717-Ditylum_brightwellii.AAC.1
MPSPSQSKQDTIDYNDPAAKHARNAFDEVDTSKKGSLPTSEFENLVDAVGEGFHGDELDKQLSLVDPNNKGQIERTSFISWYVKLVKGDDNDGDGDDEGSLDSEELAEREEEKEKALEAFESVADSGSRTIDVGDFGKLMEAMGTTYCEEEHRRTIRKISTDGKIERSNFVDWYMDWLFGDGEEEDESDYEDSEEKEEEEDKEDTTKNNTSGGSSGGWGNTFKTDEGSWKCAVCMVQNPKDKTVCLACETVRPGYENEEGTTDKDKSAGDTSASIGAGGFTFGGAAAASGGAGSGGFTFGTTAASSALASAAGTTGEGKGAPAFGSGGFSFGFTGASEAGKKDTASTSSVEKAAGGFTFGGTPAAAPSSGGFNFSSFGSALGSKAADDAATKKETKAEPVAEKVKKNKEDSKLSSSGGYPPMSSKAPTPFGGAGAAAT